MIPAEVSQGNTTISVIIYSVFVSDTVGIEVRWRNIMGVRIWSGDHN